MLDVHPPEHAAHSWRDFFIHIATIVVGLLIAVGLEQTVEAIHHNHQRIELREAMDRESHQILKDAGASSGVMDHHLQWLTERSQVIRDAVWAGKPIPPQPPYPKPDFDYPDDPLWREAKSSGLTAFLSTDERNAYSEVELLAREISAAHDRWRESELKCMEFEKGFMPLPDGDPTSQKLRLWISEPTFSSSRRRCSNYPGFADSTTKSWEQSTPSSITT